LNEIKAFFLTGTKKIVGIINVIFDPTCDFQGGILLPQRSERYQGGQEGYRGKGGISMFMLM
jgi:hypothetical protein